MPLEKSDTPNLKFQFSIRALLVITAIVAIICSSYRAGGIVALTVNLKCGSVVGLVFLLSTWQGLRWYSLTIFAGALIGGAIAVDIAAFRFSQMVQGLKFDDLVSMVNWGGNSLLGAVVGGFTSVGIAKIVLVWQQYRANKMPSKFDSPFCND